MVVRRVLVAAAVPILLAGCTLQSGAGQPGDKTNPDAALPVAVMSGDGAGAPPAGQTTVIDDFVDALEDVSSGRVDARIDSRYSDPASKDGEAQLVKDLASGAVDAAVVPTRAFSAAGIPVLDILETPFLINSYGAERTLVGSSFADTLLARFDGSGIHPLAFAVGPLRRAVVAGPALTDGDAWQGKRIRTNASRVQDDTIRALGATAVHERFEWNQMIAAGKLDGAEADVTNMAQRHVGYGMVVTGNVVLWPKISVLAVSDQFWKSLDATQQGWLTAAAAKARDSSIAAPWDDDETAGTLCKAGVRFAMSSDRQRAALVAAVAPVTTRLSSDPAYATLHDMMSSRPVVALKVPASCLSSVPAVEKPTPTPPASATALPAFPDGAFRVRISEAEVLAAGLSNNDGASGTWTLRVSDGRYTMECVPNTGSQRDCGNATDPLGGPLEAGTITPSADSYRFHSKAETMASLGRCTLPVDPTEAGGHCGPDLHYRVGPVSLDGDTLVITDYDGSAQGFALKPWDRIS